MLCKHCSEITKMSVCYQHYFHHKSKQKSKEGTMKKINSISAKTITKGQRNGSLDFFFSLFSANGLVGD